MRGLVQIVVLAALLGGASAAGAQPAKVSERARTLVEAAGRAYGLGKYDFAIQAFEQAYGHTRDPELLFSLAEAYRQRYAVAAAPGDLAQAVVHYRRYLGASAAGGERARAERALATLEAQLARVAPDGSLPASAVRETVVTRLSVMSSALGATVRIDGGAAERLPLFVEVAPGPHTLAVHAPGYLDETRPIRVTQGAVHAAKVELDPQPAKLVVSAPSGATVHVDGKRVGTTPLAKPLEVEPGDRFVSITKTGFAPWAKTLRVERGATSGVTADLSSTRQRRAAWAFVGTGGAGIATGITLGVLSVVQIRKARDIGRVDPKVRTAEEQRRYDDAIASRDDFRVASGIAGGFGLGLFLVGGALLVLDDPVVPAPPGPARDRRAAIRPKDRARSSEAHTNVELYGAPVVGPGLAGGALTVRF